jgi:hypothetical protein
MRVAPRRDGEAQPTRIAILAPCHRLRRAGITSLALAISKVTAPFRVSASIVQFGGADEASSSPSYCEPPSSSRFRPIPLTSIISS